MFILLQSMGRSDVFNLQDTAAKGFSHFGLSNYKNGGRVLVVVVRNFGAKHKIKLEDIHLSLRIM